MLHYRRYLYLIFSPLPEHLKELGQRTVTMMNLISMRLPRLELLLQVTYTLRGIFKEITLIT